VSTGVGRRRRDPSLEITQGLALGLGDVGGAFEGDAVIDVAVLWRDVEVPHTATMSDGE